MTRTPPPSMRAGARRSWPAALAFAAGAIAWPLAAPPLPDTLESRIYVANDADHRIDVFDVDRGHTLHHSITPRLNGRDLLDSRCRGLAAHAASRRLYFTDSDQANVVAQGEGFRWSSAIILG